MKDLLIISSAIYLSVGCIRTLSEFFNMKDANRFALHLMASFIAIGSLVAASFNLF